MLRVEDVSKRFGEVVALASVSLQVSAGHTVALIGPSGGGKSTLLRVMSGMVVPDTGRVLLAGREVTPAVAPALRQRLGFVVQGGGLFPHLTVRANVVLMARFLGWEAERTEARLEVLRALMRLPADALDRYPAQLSGGQRQRVALMRALFLEPDLLLLDEPLGALDPVTRVELQEDLRALFLRLRPTVVLVTHDLGEAAFLADRLVLLAGGRILQEGSLEALATRPASPYVQRFLQAWRPLALPVREGGT